MRGRRTLFATTGIILTLSTALFLLLSLFAIGYFVLVPVSRQAADDLAALISLSAKTWVELPPNTRPDFERELFAHHNLKLELADPRRAEDFSPTPELYLQFLERALSRRTGQSIHIMRLESVDDWFHVNITVSDRQLEVAFQEERLGTRFTLAALLIVSGGTLIVLLTSMLLVRRVTRPLEHLSDAVARVGSGRSFKPLPVTGPEELARLARRFNQMEMQVRELLENRTTLLAGISHDLRTPIARMRIALEMLPAHTDPFLIGQFESDLREMDHLIQQALELARGLGNQPKTTVELAGFLTDLAERYRKEGAAIELEAPKPCETRLTAVALRRVLGNLIDNALRFSGEDSVKIVLRVEARRIVISVLDKGPGIPEEEADAVFQPFHRLEDSRSRSTGGSGLGLAIARQLCDANLWSVELRARPRGGTEARLTIPR